MPDLCASLGLPASPVLQVELAVPPDTTDLVRYLNNTVSMSLPPGVVGRRELEQGVPLYHPTSGQRVGTVRLA